MSKKISFINNNWVCIRWTKLLLLILNQLGMCWCLPMFLELSFHNIGTQIQTKNRLRFFAWSLKVFIHFYLLLFQSKKLALGNKICENKWWHKPFLREKKFNSWFFHSYGTVSKIELQKNRKHRYIFSNKDIFIRAVPKVINCF